MFIAITMMMVACVNAMGIEDKTFKVIRNKLSYEERIQHRINAFRNDLFESDNLEYSETILHIIWDYLTQYDDDDDINQATYKLKECIFYVSNYNQDRGA